MEIVSYFLIGKVVLHHQSDTYLTHRESVIGLQASDKSTGNILNMLEYRIYIADETFVDFSPAWRWQREEEARSEFAEEYYLQLPREFWQSLSPIAPRIWIRGQTRLRPLSHRSHCIGLFLFMVRSARKSSLNVSSSL